MPDYVLIDPATGWQTTLSEVELTRNLQLNCILLRDGEHIGIITHRDLVAFARWCAGKMLARLVDEPDLKVTHALTMVDQWLDDELSITSEELKDAAKAAARAGAEAAARAAWAAAEAIWAAVDAADAAEAAADVARSAEDRGLSYKSQAQWFVEHLKSGQ